MASRHGMEPSRRDIYEEEWFPPCHLHQGDHHHSGCISSLETDIYHENKNSQHQGQRHLGKGKGQHCNLDQDHYHQRSQDHQAPAGSILHQQPGHHQHRHYHRGDTTHLVDREGQDSHQGLETGAHPTQGDHQDRHQARVLHQNSREHHRHDAHLLHHRMNGGHRRQHIQHHLGWLPLLCLQGIFQLLPEALGQPSHLLYQDQPSLLHDSLQEQHQLHLQHHPLPQVIHLHSQHEPPGHSQHLPPHPACHLHRQLTAHQYRQHLLLASDLALQHLLRVYQHLLASQRTMKPSSMHHHHNDLMTTTPLLS